MGMRIRTLGIMACMLLSACGGDANDGGGDSDDVDTVAAAPVPVAIPPVTECSGNTINCEQADSTVEEAAAQGVPEIVVVENDTPESPDPSLDCGDSTLGTCARECIAVICSNGPVNIGNTTTTTTTTTVTNPAERWANVVSLEVRR